MVVSLHATPHPTEKNNQFFWLSSCFTHKNCSGGGVLRGGTTISCRTSFPSFPSLPTFPSLSEQYCTHSYSLFPTLESEQVQNFHRKLPSDQFHLCPSWHNTLDHHDLELVVHFVLGWYQIFCWLQLYPGCSMLKRR
jgi:hypothetical protein